MEPKKNPVHDVHRYRPVIFGCSLIVSLLTVIVVFEISVEKIERKSPPEEASILATPIIEYAIANIEEKRPKQVRQMNPDIIMEVKDDPVISENEPDLIVEPASTDATEVIHVEPLPIEKIEDGEFRVVEHMPEPEGGLEGFYKLLKKNMKYPKKAQRNNTQGKVFVEFTVGKNGVVTNLIVIKGLGDGCDEEALRVIALSKWTPGKQRGVPVNVRMVQAINFQLQQ